jgi:hypothetical protein
MSTSSDDAAAARAAEQARLRKERREAKIKSGGAARLNRITGLGGGIQRGAQQLPWQQNPGANLFPIILLYCEQANRLPPLSDAPPVPANEAAGTAPKPAAATQEAQHADPEEVDISEHFYAPRTTDRIPQHNLPISATPPLDPAAGMSEAQLRQMMLGFDRVGGPGAGAGFGGGGGGGGGAGEDPIMKVLQQMMSNGGGPPLPGGANPFGPQQQQQQIVIPDRYSALWRLLHTAVALGLGLYIALWTSFSGTKLERDASGLPSGGRRGDKLGGEEVVEGLDPRLFFWVFATAETVLLTTRFFLDRTRAPPSGILWTISSFLPEPFKGYLGIGLRYGQIFSTVRSDILVCIFVLGVCSWLRAA